MYNHPRSYLEKWRDDCLTCTRLDFFIFFLLTGNIFRGLSILIRQYIIEETPFFFCSLYNPSFFFSLFLFAPPLYLLFTSTLFLPMSTMASFLHLDNVIFVRLSERGFKCHNLGNEDFSLLHWRQKPFFTAENFLSLPFNNLVIKTVIQIHLFFLIIYKQLKIISKILLVQFLILTNHS